MPIRIQEKLLYRHSAYTVGKSHCWRLRIDLRNCDQKGSKILVFELLQRRSFLDFEDKSSKQPIFLWHSTDLGKKSENRRQKFQKKVFLAQNQTSL